MLTRILSTTILLAAGYIALIAQNPGSFDPTFGTEGKTIVPIGTANAFGRAVVIQPDGKAVMACIANNGTDTDFVIARFATNGDPDASLDEDGIVLTDFDGRSDIAEGIALDAFNRIIIAGSVDSGDGFGFGAARYLPDGTLDQTFGDQGLVTKKTGITGFCKALAVQQDNKIVLGGYVLNPISLTNEFVVMRFNTNGTPDSTFHDDGIVMTNMGIGAGVANAMLIQPDGKIVLAGQALNEATLRWEIAIVRINPDGSPDQTWDEDGVVFTGSQDADFTIKAVALQEDRKILVGGFFGTAPSNNLFAVARYHPGGGLDETFGTEGIVLDSYGDQDNQINSIVLQPDGQILIAGTSLKGNRDLFAIARLDPDGSFDGTFGEGGVVRPVIEQNDGIHSIALQEDGKLLVAGESFNGQRFSIVVARIETGLMTSTDDPVETDINATVFPNPVSDELLITYRLSQPASIRWLLFDQAGRIVFEEPVTLKQDAGEYVKTIEIPMHIGSGIYTLTLVSHDGYADGAKVMVVR
ncbi:MAG TPA: T9SS type A sorting domain-containing protein [Saprospiraceae bacterium]|nr:T9SS type A sorting domain-containing protein [Saprospiraceae bacterium]